MKYRHTLSLLAEDKRRTEHRKQKEAIADRVKRTEVNVKRHKLLKQAIKDGNKKLIEKYSLPLRIIIKSSKTKVKKIRETVKKLSKMAGKAGDIRKISLESEKHDNP